MNFRHILFKHALTLVSALVMVVVSGLQTSVAEAKLSSCRGDPVFVFSDGTILDVTVEIGTDVSNVTEIHYVVHGPPGVELVTSLSTPTLGFTGKEFVTYYADGRPDRFVTDTLVRTKVKDVPVTAYSTFAGLDLGLLPSLSVQYKPIRGFNDQHLIATLTK